MNLEDAQSLIHAKMKAQRPTLREYLRTMRNCCAKNEQEWEMTGAMEQASYACGQWYAYRDIERLLEQDGFNPEPTQCNEAGKLTT